MNKEEILIKINKDIDYVPSLEEYKLISNEQFFIGKSPVFTIIFTDLKDKDLMSGIENETKDSRPNGLYELYCQLQCNGYCETYAEDRLYYLAYTLASKGIDFVINGIEYKFKLGKKRNRLAELKKQLEEL
jgi:hypothetical protein